MTNKVLMCLRCMFFYKIYLLSIETAEFVPQVSHDFTNFVHAADDSITPPLKQRLIAFLCIFAEKNR